MVYGATLIAQSLADLGVQVVFGLPGLPVIDIAQECMNLGISFISFRNEQAAVLAACAYGYLTRRPGVCICVGGPGVLNTLAGIPHAAANAWPLLVLAGSSETHNANKGAFQEMDAIPMVQGLGVAKLALRPPLPEMVPEFIRDAYRASFFGRPGPAFVDLPADLILGQHDNLQRRVLRRIGDEEVPRSCAPEGRIRAVVETLKGARAPLVVVGKGAAYARAEGVIRRLVESTNLPFLPTPMGKGILPDSSPLNISAARSTALKHADVVLLLGARLNWILSFGLPPKWSPSVKIIQVDLCADEMGRNGHDASLSLLGDVGLVSAQLADALSGWRFDAGGQGAEFTKTVREAKARNEQKAAAKARDSKVPMTYEHVFAVIKRELDALSPPEDGGVVYVSEGANAMDISRSIFTMEYPRTKLDAGTYATMGVGLAYAIASYAAYNYPRAEGIVGVDIAGRGDGGGGKATGGAAATPTPYGGASGADTGRGQHFAGKAAGGATATPTPYGGASGAADANQGHSQGKAAGGATSTPTPYGGASGAGSQDRGGHSDGTAAGGATSTPTPYGGASGAATTSTSQHTTTTSTSRSINSLSKKKKIVAIEGDSAFGFSGMEIETMTRYRMDILVFVINNSGLYRGDANTRADWKKRQDLTLKGTPAAPRLGDGPGGLTATSLGYETEYQKMAELAGEGGGWGVVVRTPEELADATRRGFEADVPVVVNVLVDTTKDLVMDFSWLDMAPPDVKNKAKKKKEQKL